VNNKAYLILKLILFIVAITQSLTAQIAFDFKGVVMSSESYSPLSEISVFNVNLKLNTFSDINGRYALPVREKDTVYFIHNDWEKKVVIGSDLVDSIFLVKKGIQLDEVVVIHNTQKSRVTILENQEKELNKKGGIYYGGKPPISLLSPFGGKPLTFFYELLSKNGKKAREISREISMEREVEQVDRMFNAEIIKSVVPLEGEELDDFIRKFRPSPTQVARWTIYDAYVYIKESFTTYRESESE